MDRRAGVQGIYFNRMRWLATRNPMRLSTTEVRDVSMDGGRVSGRGRAVSRLHRRANKQAGVSRGRSNHITPGLIPTPRHTRHLSVRRYGDGPGCA